MSSSYMVRCPSCAHETPWPSGRNFLTCTCGLRLACGRAPDARFRAEVLLALLTLAAMVGAAFDLVRRIW